MKPKTMGVAVVSAGPQAYHLHLTFVYVKMLPCLSVYTDKHARISTQNTNVNKEIFCIYCLQCFDTVHWVTGRA